MARIPEGYDRDVAIVKGQTEVARRRAIQEKDIEAWKSIRSMYLTGCFETHLEEGGDPRKPSSELLGEIEMVKREAAEHFGVRVYVVIRKVGKDFMLVLVNDGNTKGAL